MKKPKQSLKNCIVLLEPIELTKDGFSRKLCQKNKRLSGTFSLTVLQLDGTKMMFAEDKDKPGFPMLFNVEILVPDKKLMKLCGYETK